MDIRRSMGLDRKLIFLAIGIVIFLLCLYYTPVQIYSYIKKNPTLVFVSFTPLVAYFSWQTQRHLTRAKYTMDFQVSFSDSDNMKKAAKVFKSSIRFMNTDELIKLANEEKPAKVHKHAMEILNAWERVAVALKHDVYDEDMLYDVYGSFLLKTCQTLSPYIKEKQRSNPLVFINLQRLVICWKVRRSAFESKTERIDSKKDFRQLGKIIARN